MLPCVGKIYMKNPNSGVKESIYARRSIRKFLAKPVPEDLLCQVIDAGRVSPSPTNTQPWYFYIFSGKDTQEITAILYETAENIRVLGYKNIILESAKTVAGAPHIITVWNMKHFSRRLKKIEGFIGEEYYKDYERAELLSVGCAVENMWIMAHHLGLGMVWINSSLGCVEKCTKKFGIDGDIIAYIPIGYPLENKTIMKKKRKALSDICKFYSSQPKEF